MCNKLFDEEVALDKHLEHCKKAAAKEKSQKDEEQLLKKKLLEFSCSKCERFFMSEDLLVKHVQDAHSVSSELNIEPKELTARTENLTKHRDQNNNEGNHDNQSQKKEIKKADPGTIKTEQKSRNEKQVEVNVKEINRKTLQSNDNDGIEDNHDASDDDLCAKIENFAKQREQDASLGKNTTNFMCEVCNKEFGIKSNFDKHQQNCRKAERNVSLPTKPSTEITTLPQPLDKHFIGPKCAVCYQRFNSDSLLVKHAGGALSEDARTGVAFCNIRMYYLQRIIPYSGSVQSSSVYNKCSGHGCFEHTK